MARNYTYRKLSYDDSIRVLTIRPGSRLEDLHAGLEEVRLQDNPEYEAISYCWGEPVFSATVHLDKDGSQLRITPNVSSALQQVRNQHQSRTIWVDAICIDQTNECERGHQVWLMSRVYSNAKQVLIWLSEGSVETHSAVQCLRTFADRADELEMRWHPDDFIEGPDELEWSSEDVQNIVEGGKQAHVFDLLRCPWYNRLWVIQEVFLAKTATVICGADTISWTHFGRALKIFANAITAADSWSSLDSQDNEDLHWAEMIISTRGWFRMWSNPRSIVIQPWSDDFILGIFEKFRNQQCCDDRDRVYGFLALCGQAHGIEFKPNYRWTVHQTYKEFAKYVIKVGGLHILDHAGLGQREEPSTNNDISELDYLPSWAPDFRPTRITSRLPVTLRSGDFTTAANWDGVINWTKKSENILLFKGDIFDDLLVLLRCGPEVTSPNIAVKHLKEWYDSLGLESYPTGEKNLHAFLRTLIMDDKRIDIEHLTALWEAYEAVVFGDGDSDDHDQSTMQQAFELHNRMGAAFRLDSLVVTKKGFLGLVPYATEIGDRIAIISGRDKPIVVRWAEKYSAYLLIGSCFIHGLMEWDFDNPTGKYVDSWIPIA